MARNVRSWYSIEEVGAGIGVARVSVKFSSVSIRRVQFLSCKRDSSNEIFICGIITVQT